MFTVQGQIRGLGETYYAISWDAGQLDGPPWLQVLAQIDADVRDGEPLGPVGGPYSTTRHLRNETGALRILTDLFTSSSVRITGDVPSRESLPDGAVG